MKKIIILSLVCTLLFAITFNSHADINYLHESPLDIQQSINDMGNGLWEYNFSFINTDSSPIWHLLLYTTENTTDLTSSFEHAGSFLIETAYSPYDPRHIDPSLTYANTIFYGADLYNFATYGLDVGAAATMSFQSAYQGYNFLYVYETVDSGYAHTNGGYVASMGYTSIVPEPISSVLFLAGGTLIAGRRIIKRKTA
ncbi:MAG: hypothetical protein AB1499_08560 [Nitrospirota bacterium]